MMPDWRFDRYGRLCVRGARIFRAGVCCFCGDELGGQRYGLDPGRNYAALMPPDELSVAARSFCEVPLLRDHVDDYQVEDIIGWVSDAYFEDPFLVARLLVWDRAAIAQIERLARRELSALIRHSLRLRSGIFRGAPFDVVLIRMHAMHVALVADGRLGPEVGIMPPRSHTAGLAA